MLKFEFLRGTEVAEAFQALVPRARENMSRTMMRLVLELTRRVKQDKLTGQALKVRTGRLRRSINGQVTGQGTDTVDGVVGTNVAYARAHEYGFKGTVSVREHLRRTKAGNRVPVKGHSRKVDLPERSFLRSAQREMEPQIRQALRNAIKDAL